jgi:hypothetical protein
MRVITEDTCSNCYLYIRGGTTCKGSCRPIPRAKDTLCDNPGKYSPIYFIVQVTERDLVSSH